MEAHRRRVRRGLCTGGADTAQRFGGCGIGDGRAVVLRSGCERLDFGGWQRRSFVEYEPERVPAKAITITSNLNCKGVRLCPGALLLLEVTTQGKAGGAACEW